MYTCLRSLASFSFVACVLLGTSSPARAQRARPTQTPSTSTTLDVPLGCSPHFVGQQLVLGEQPLDLVLADLDGDGDLDLATADMQSGIATAFNRLGELQPGATYPIAGRPFRLVAGDVDGNGSADLVACLLDSSTPESTPTIAVMLNRGRGLFAPPVEYATGAASAVGANQPRSVALADLDGDGDRDLAVANLNWRFVVDPDFGVFNDATVALLVNQGDGTFGAPSETPMGPPDTSLGDDQEPSYVVAEDLDADGDVDLAVTVGDQDSLYVLENLGAGAFSVSAPYSVDSQPGALVAADLDGDGDRDLAVTKSQVDSFAVLLNQGSATFAPATSQASGWFSYPSSISCADFDGDGDRDLAFVAGALEVALNQGNGAFDFPQGLAGHLRPDEVASGDLDGNGTIDLASVDGRTVSLYRNLGGATFETAPRYAAGPDPRAIASADVDGDGDRDLVVGSGPPGLQRKVSVLGNIGAGSFAPPVEYSALNQPTAIALPDLDQDGSVDLVVAENTRVQVGRNQGDGSFGTLTGFGAGPLPNGITSADLDGDGDLDVATSLASSNTLGILPGLGNGSLAHVVNYPSGFAANGITGGDLDLDGDVDLVVVGDDTGTAELFDNQGTGTFALLPGIAAGGNPLAITSVDFDSDGRIDLAVVVELSNPHNTLAGGALAGVLRNAGSASFEPPMLQPVGNWPLGGFLQADLDRDASPDLVVVSNNLQSITLLTSFVNGAFASRMAITARDPTGVTCADLDGDGDLDLASTARSSDAVEIHLNSCRLGNGF